MFTGSFPCFSYRQALLTIAILLVSAAKQFAMTGDHPLIGLWIGSKDNTCALYSINTNSVLSIHMIEGSFTGTARYRIDSMNDEKGRMQVTCLEAEGALATELLRYVVEIKYRFVPDGCSFGLQRLYFVDAAMGPVCRRIQPIDTAPFDFMHQHLTASQTAAAGKRNAIVLTLGMSLNGGGLPEIISGDGFSEMEKEELAFRPFDTDTGLTASLSYSFEKFYCGLSLGYLFFSYSKQPIEKRYGTLGNTYPRGYDFKTRKVPILAIFGFKLGKTTGLEFAAGICPSSYAFKQTKLPGVPLGYYDPPVLRDENMRFTALQVSARFIVDILVHDTGIFQLNFEGGLLKNPQDPWPHLRIGLGAQWAFTHL